MSVSKADGCTHSETPLAALREMKKRACETLSSLAQEISSSSSAKRSKTSWESFSTYKSLIKSYKFVLWAGNEISPRELAVYGWECKAPDQVQCIACRQFLCTSLPKITDVDIGVYNRLIRRIREQIISSHLLTCLYRSKPLEFKHDVDENFINHFVRPKVLTYNVDGLALKMHIPEVAKNVRGVKISSDDAVVGASLGWSIETENIAGRKQFVAVCEYCARSFVLGHTGFDPVKTHQRWCPLLDLNADDGVPLWAGIYKRMIPSRYQRTSPVSRIEVERAKRVLDRSLSLILGEIPCDSL